MVFKIGIIGLGMIGEIMLEAFHLHPQFEVESCWDLSSEVCEHIRSTQPYAPIVSSGEEVLDHDNLDMIYIATPPVTHSDYGHKVIERGKPLFMEKPLTLGLDQGRKLVEAAEAKGIPTVMNFGYGAGPLVDALGNAMGNGELGTIISIEIRYEFPSWPLPNQQSAASWITSQNTGGMVREMFSHHVYLTHRLLGKLEVVSVILNYPDGENSAEDFALASLQSGDVAVWFMGGIGSPGTPRYSNYTVNGDKFSMRISEAGELLQTRNGKWEQVNIPPSPTAVEDRLSQVAQLLEGKESKLPTLRDGYEVQKVIEEMLSSAKRRN